MADNHPPADALAGQLAEFDRDHLRFLQYRFPSKSMEDLQKLLSGSAGIRAGAPPIPQPHPNMDGTHRTPLGVQPPAQVRQQGPAPPHFYPPYQMYGQPHSFAYQHVVPNSVLDWHFAGFPMMPENMVPAGAAAGTAPIRRGNLGPAPPGLTPQVPRMRHQGPAPPGMAPHGMVPPVANLPRMGHQGSNPSGLVPPRLDPLAMTPQGLTAPELMPKAGEQAAQGPGDGRVTSPSRQAAGNHHSPILLGLLSNHTIPNNPAAHIPSAMAPQQMPITADSFGAPRAPSPARTIILSDDEEDKGEDGSHDQSPVFGPQNLAANAAGPSNVTIAHLIASQDGNNLPQVPSATSSTPPAKKRTLNEIVNDILQQSGANSSADVNAAQTDASAVSAAPEPVKKRNRPPKMSDQIVELKIQLEKQKEDHARDTIKLDEAIGKIEELKRRLAATEKSAANPRSFSSTESQTDDALQPTTTTIVTPKPAPLAPFPLWTHTYDLSIRDDSTFVEHRKAISRFVKEASRNLPIPPIEGTEEFMTLRRAAIQNRKIDGPDLIATDLHLFNGANKELPQLVEAIPSLQEVYQRHQAMLGEMKRTERAKAADWKQFSESKPPLYWDLRESLAGVLDEQANQLVKGFIRIQKTKKPLPRRKRTGEADHDYVTKKRVDDEECDADMDDGRAGPSEKKMSKKIPEKRPEGGVDDEDVVDAPAVNGAEEVDEMAD